MFRLPKHTEIDPIQLQKFIDRHRKEVKNRYQYLYDAYTLIRKANR